MAAAVAAVIALLALASPALAMSSDPLQFEGADGDQVVTTSGNSDWQNIGSMAGSVRSVTDGTGASDDTFATGSENSPQTWKFQAGAANAKSDILNFWADSHPPIATPTLSPSGFLYLAFRRASDNTNPSAAMEFEVNQSTATWNNGSAVIPCRNNGDLLISYNVTPAGQGVSIASLVAYKWQSNGAGPAACPGGEGQWVDTGPAISSAFEGAMLGSSITNYLDPATNGATFDANTFGEASIDLNSLMTAAGWPVGTCVPFVQTQVRSRSSGSSINNSLVDAVAPIVFSDPLQACAAPPPGTINPSIGSVTAAGTCVSGQLHASWTPAYQGDGALAHYTVVVTDPLGNAVGSPITLEPTTTDTDINGLVDGVQYTITVTAVNSNGHSGSKSATGASGTCPPPSSGNPGSGPVAGSVATVQPQQHVLGARIILPSNKGCVNRSKFTFTLHHAVGQPVVNVVVFVNGKKKLTKRGANITTVTLRRLPAGRFTVRVVATQKSGSKLISKRTYKACKKSKPKTRGHHRRHH